MKIVFLVRSLYFGGAERQLIILAKGLRERGHDVVVALFYSGGGLEKECQDAGIRIRQLNKGGRWDVWRFLLTTAKVIREERPDILYGCLPDQNLVAMALKPFFTTAKVVWAIAMSYMDLSKCDWVTRMSIALNRWLSRFPDAIIANSQAGCDFHRALGYPKETTVIVRNGIDSDRFRPDSQMRDRVRCAMGLEKDIKLIGLLGRLDPQKDHATFLQAAALLVQEKRAVKFVCVGDGPAGYLFSLQQLAESLGLTAHLMWLCAQEDPERIYNGLDLLVSSSAYGEGVSNVIGEAMACGVPCVVTDVGDSAWLVGDLGAVVPKKDPVALKEAMERALYSRTYDPVQIRGRIVNHLSIHDLVTKTEQVLNLAFQGRKSKRVTDRPKATLPSGHF